MGNQDPIINVASTGVLGSPAESGFAAPQQLATARAQEVAERWAPVVGSDRHEVSTLGRLRSWRMGKRALRLTSPVDVKPRRIAEGCLGFGVQSYLHLAVLEAFVGPCHEGHEAAHGDGNKRNCALANLRWATHAGNIADKVRHGTCSSRRKPNLTPAQVEEIIRRRETGELRASIARAFDVTSQTVTRAAQRAP